MFDSKSIRAILIAIMIWIGAVWKFKGLLPNFICPLKYMTNIPCPFCGLTRSCYFLLCGKLKTAMWMNPLIIVLICLLILMLIGVVSTAFLSWLERSKTYIYTFLCMTICSTWIFLIIHNRTLGIY